MSEARYTQTEVAERRRTRRRRLQRQTVVRILPASGPDNRLLEAQMLNLSEHGLACRLPRDEAARFRAGHKVGIHFDLDPAAAPFDLPGRIINVTPGGTADRCIVGIELEFPYDQRREQQRLRRILGAAAWDQEDRESP